MRRRCQVQQCLASVAGSRRFSAPRPKAFLLIFGRRDAQGPAPVPNGSERSGSSAGSPVEDDRLFFFPILRRSCESFAISRVLEAEHPLLGERCTVKASQSQNPCRAAAFLVRFFNDDHPGPNELACAGTLAGVSPPTCDKKLFCNFSSCSAWDWIHSPKSHGFGKPTLLFVEGNMVIQVAMFHFQIISGISILLSEHV